MQVTLRPTCASDAVQYNSEMNNQNTSSNMACLNDASL